MLDQQRVTITRLGAQGDGIVDRGALPIAVAFALPGEVVRLNADGQLAEVETPSADRVLPLCPHFMRCGGCCVQHLSDDAIRTWKRNAVVAAFAARGLDIQVGDVIGPLGQRRRAVFTALRDGDDVMLGYHAARSHDLIDLETCIVVEPALERALPALRDLLRLVLPRKQDARVTVVATQAGLDIGVDGIKRELTPKLRADIASASAGKGLARLSINGEPVIAFAAPFLVFGGVHVGLPPGSFIQAVGEVEAEMARLIVAAVGKVKSVADLFSGLGAFTFPLAASAKVAAFDSDGTAIATLSEAVKMARGIKPVSATRRDLMREPLSTVELKDFDAVVFDPPRAGAEAQARMLAKSKVKTVVAASCNPATLARDSRILIDGGYRLQSVTPIDQFQYSHHVEVVAAFTR